MNARHLLSILTHAIVEQTPAQINQMCAAHMLEGMGYKVLLRDDESIIVDLSSVYFLGPFAIIFREYVRLDVSEDLSEVAEFLAIMGG
jgi:hypothetical protein